MRLLNELVRLFSKLRPIPSGTFTVPELRLWLDLKQHLVEEGR